MATRKKAPKKKSNPSNLNRTATGAAAGDARIKPMTKLQRAEERFNRLRQQFHEYATSVRNRREIVSFHAEQQFDAGKLATIEVTSLIAAVSTATSLGKNTELRVVGSTDPKAPAKLEVVFVDRVPSAPSVY